MNRGQLSYAKEAIQVINAYEGWDLVQIILDNSRLSEAFDKIFFRCIPCSFNEWAHRIA